MKALLLYPQYPDTFWSFKHALKFISKKVSEPPLGLLTVASMLPDSWNLKLVDMNAESLKDYDIEWSDIVLISAMSIQSQSVTEVIARCKKMGKRIVAGGPLFTAAPDKFAEVDHLVLNEAELTLPPFLADLENGCAEHIYTSAVFPDLADTPVPNWSLLNRKNYAMMDIQFSRGCPYNCDFCDIVQLFGRKVRTKSVGQVIAELEAIYDTGWRGGVFFVDDNFIGNKKVLKRSILPELIRWMEKRKSPFAFNTEASINLADDDELLNLMVKAGFESVFIGIESPNADSLIECNKVQNKNRNLLESINKIQSKGLMVKGGFIVGFDSDPPSIFEKVTEFIQDSSIVNAMVGLLNAPRGTKLYQRLKNEGRLLADVSGNNTDFSMNFKPKMDYDKILEGYQSIIQGIYSAKPYYERVKKYLRIYKPVPKQVQKFRPALLKPFFKSVIFIGITGRDRRYFWKLFFWTLFRKPKLMPLAMTFAVYGFHFRKVFEGIV